MPEKSNDKTTIFFIRDQLLSQLLILNKILGVLHVSASNTLE